jgi:DNA-binding NtrC family response regulator
MDTSPQIKVLVVDDEREFAQALGERLEVRGIAVRVALNGDEALSRLEQQQEDVVILDVKMPGRGGLETLQEIKHRWPLVEVIMLTGHATVEVAIEGMKLGAHDFLMKPTETDELMAKIRKAHDRKAEQEERIRQADISRIIQRRGY